LSPRNVPPVRRRHPAAAPAPTLAPGPEPAAGNEAESELLEDDDSLPIVIVPDDVDIDGELLAPEPAPVEVESPGPVAVEPEPQEEETELQVEADPELAELSRIVSLKDLESEIQDEFSLEGEGGRDLFFMPRLCKYAALGVLALLAVVLYIGWGYYRLPLVLRPLHYLHAMLRPSGYVGLSLGIAGAGVMLSSLLYLVRKGLLSWGRIGSLQSWMGFHILTGLMGPAIALYHAAFVPTSALGFLMVGAMAIVIISGVIGRYIAVHFPRSLGGRELKFEEIRGRLAVYKKKLVALGVDPTMLRLETPESSTRAPWLLASIGRVLSGDWESRKEYRRLKEALTARGQVRIEMELVLYLIRRLCRERQWLVRYGEFRRVMGSWRFFHRWLAIVLLAGLAFHVLVATRFGGLWILGGQR
jgi:hypothetical protein